MKKQWIILSALVMMLSGILPAAFAVGEGIQEQTLPPAVHHKRASLPKHHTTASKQQNATLRGSIAALDLKAAKPTLSLKVSDGQTITLPLNVKNVSVKQKGHKRARISSLKVGQEVKIKAKEKKDTKVIKEITIL